MAQRVFKNPDQQANSLIRKKGDTFTFGGKGAWSGSVNSLDGTIEETHPYKRAKDYDFHHSLYFSDPAIERIDSGDSLFFYVDEGGNIKLNPTARGDGRQIDENLIINAIKKQINI